MATGHKGIKEYEGGEAGALSIGAGGFEVLTTNTNISGNFIAFKVTGGTALRTCNVEALTAHGDDLPDTIFLTGEMVYGPFTKITTTSIGVGVIVMCYKGRD